MEAKEDIFYDKCDCNTEDGTMALTKDAAFEAMDIHARNVAIEFADWIEREGIRGGGEYQKGEWFYPDGEGAALTTEQLYTLFEQSIQNKEL